MSPDRLVDGYFASWNLVLDFRVGAECCVLELQMLCGCLVSLNAGFMPSRSFDGCVFGEDDTILLFSRSRVLIYMYFSSRSCGAIHTPSV